MILQGSYFWPFYSINDLKISIGQTFTKLKKIQISSYIKSGREYLKGHRVESK